MLETTIVSSTIRPLREYVVPRRTLDSLVAHRPCCESETPSVWDRSYFRQHPSQDTCQETVSNAGDKSDKISYRQVLDKTRLLPVSLPRLAHWNIPRTMCMEDHTIRPHTEGLVPINGKEYRFLWKQIHVTMKAISAIFFFHTPKLWFLTFRSNHAKKRWCTPNMGSWKYLHRQVLECAPDDCLELQKADRTCPASSNRIRNMFASIEC